MSKNILFIGTSKSPLALERYEMIKNNIKHSNIYFYDLNENKKKKEFIHFQPLKGKLQHIVSFFHSLYIAYKYKINYVHYHGANHLFVNFMPYFVPNITVIVTIQGSEINDAYIGTNKTIVNALLKRADKITVKSNFMKELVLNISKKVKSKLIDFNWGVDDLLFKLSRALEEEEKINIISFRGSTYPYNIDIVFDGIKLLKNKYKNIVFTYVEFNKTSDVILDMEIVDKHYQSLNKKELFDVLKEQDIMISIPSYDGFATSIMESLSLGVLPVISDLSSYKKENLDDYVIKLKNIDATSLEKAIDKALKTKCLVSEKEKRVKFAKQQYGKTNQIKILQKIYKIEEN